jgi:hypothetical protein
MKKGLTRRGPLFLQDDGRVGDGAEAADAGADHDAGALALCLGLGLPARVGQGLVRGGDGVDDEVIDPLAVLGRHDLLMVEHARLAGGTAAATVDRRDLARDGAAKAFGVEIGDRADARATLEDALPVMLHAPAERGEQTEAGDDDTAHERSSLQNPDHKQ